MVFRFLEDTASGTTRQTATPRRGHTNPCVRSTECNIPVGPPPGKVKDGVEVRARCGGLSWRFTTLARGSFSSSTMKLRPAESMLKKNEP